jgi:hypothetical protein
MVVLTTTAVSASAEATPTPEQKVAKAVGTSGGPAMERLLEFAIEATLPLLLIVGALMLVKNRRLLLAMSVIGGAISAIGFGRLLYNVTYDIAGSPDFALPVWAVLYLVVYLVIFFAFVFFGLHLWAPGKYVGGLLAATTPSRAFLDSLYLSLTNYISVPPDPSLTLRTPLPRYMSVIEGLLSMFVNVVVITKFVNTF